MIERGIGIAGLALAVMAMPFPFLFRKLRKRLAWTIFGGSVVLLVIGLIVAFLPAEAQTPTVGSINAPNNSGIVTNGQSGGTNIVNQAPPRSPLGLYQSGQQIGTVRGETVSANGKQITFGYPQIASGTLIVSDPIEFQGYVVLCPLLAARPQAAFNVVAADVLACDIVGKR